MAFATNRSLLRSLLMACSTELVDFVGIGDSNQVKDGRGHDHGLQYALAQRFNMYCTGAISPSENNEAGANTGYGYRKGNGSAMNAASVPVGAPSQIYEYWNEADVQADDSYRHTKLRYSCVTAAFGNDAAGLAHLGSGVGEGSGLPGGTSAARRVYCSYIRHPGGGTFRPSFRNASLGGVSHAPGVTDTNGTLGVGIMTHDSPANHTTDAQTLEWRISANVPMVIPNGAVTAVSIANPSQITMTGHGRTTGDIITLSGLGTTPDINGHHVCTVIDANTVSIPVNVTAVSDQTGTWTTRVVIGFTRSRNLSMTSGFSYTTQGYMGGRDLKDQYDALSLWTFESWRHIFDVIRAPQLDAGVTTPKVVYVIQSGLNDKNGFAKLSADGVNQTSTKAGFKANMLAIIDIIEDKYIELYGSRDGLYFAISRSHRVADFVGTEDQTDTETAMQSYGEACAEIAANAFYAPYVAAFDPSTLMTRAEFAAGDGGGSWFLTSGTDEAHMGPVATGKGYEVIWDRVVEAMLASPLSVRNRTGSTRSALRGRGRDAA